MRAINHAMTGALIGVLISEPLIAVPAAVASHFVCDAIPHYDPAGTKQQVIKSKLFRNLLYVDALLCLALVILLVCTKPQNWLLAIVCAFAAASPDFLWLKRYRSSLANKKSWRPNGFLRFASVIQWFQRPIGGVVEVAWFVGASILLLPFLR